MILFLVGQSHAMTWKETFSIATDRSNDIKSAQKGLESTKWLYYKSYGNFLPQISANMSAGSSLSNPQSFSYGLSASQSIFKGFSNYFSMQSSYINYMSDDANLKNTMANYYYSLRSAFLDLFSAQENIEVQRSILASRKKNSKMIKLLYDSGREDKGNYLRTDAQVDEAEYKVSSAERDLELARFRLSQLLEQKVTSVEGSADVSIEKMIDLDALVKKTPSFLLAKYQLDLADVAQKATISEFLPSVSLSANYSNSDTAWPPNSSSKSISLNLSYALFPGGTNIADRFIYNFRLDKAKEDFAKSQKDISYNIKQAYEHLKDAIEAYSVQNKYLIAAAERAKIAQVQYVNGLTTYDEWDRIQTEYVNYQRSEISSNKAMLLAEANWYKTYGGWVK